MFDTLLIITLFLLALLLVCLVTLRLSINIKHFPLFSFIADINGFKIFEIPIPPYCLFKSPPPSLPPRLLNLTKIFILVY